MILYSHYWPGNKEKKTEETSTKQRAQKRILSWFCLGDTFSKYQPAGNQIICELHGFLFFEAHRKLFSGVFPGAP